VANTIAPVTRHLDRRARFAWSLARRGSAGLRWRRRRLSQAARVLRPRLAFLVGEIRGGTRRYRIGPRSVLLRHRSRDIDIVNEIWGATPSYEPPLALAARLADGPLVVVDLGGNIGLFGVFAFARWDLASLTSFEPDPANAALLRRVSEINRLEHRWTVRECAVANFSGQAQLLSLGSPESHLLEQSGAGAPVQVSDLFEFEHPIDLLKIDREGGEWALLADERLRSLDAAIIVMEWHWRGAPAPDARAAAVALLRDGGYEIDSEMTGEAAAVGMLWASRPLGGTAPRRPPTGADPSL
jgi:FkbM family methyltransferase